MNERIAEPVKVVAERIVYHRLWTREESVLGGWKYSVSTIGTAEFMACGIDDADQQTRKLFPKANRVTGYFRTQSGKWEIAYAGTL